MVIRKMKTETEMKASNGTKTKFGELLSEEGYSGLALAHIRRYNRLLKWEDKDAKKVYELAIAEMNDQQKRHPDGNPWA